MDKLKKFLMTPMGLVVLLLLVVTLVVAYSSKIPGFRWIRTAASKLPGSDAPVGGASA
jgi:VIT1/CCC1 family predicted Fe2+/Mn2+ transporter